MKDEHELRWEYEERERQRAREVAMRQAEHLALYALSALFSGDIPAPTLVESVAEFVKDPVNAHYQGKLTGALMASGVWKPR